MPLAAPTFKSSQYNDRSIEAMDRVAIAALYKTTAVNYRQIGFVNRLARSI